MTKLFGCDNFVPGVEGSFNNYQCIAGACVWRGATKEEIQECPCGRMTNGMCSYCAPTDSIACNYPQTLVEGGVLLSYRYIHTDVPSDKHDYRKDINVTLPQTASLYECEGIKNCQDKFFGGKYDSLMRELYPRINAANLSQCFSAHCHRWGDGVCDETLNTKECLSLIHI